MGECKGCGNNFDTCNCGVCEDDRETLLYWKAKLAKSQERVRELEGAVKYLNSVLLPHQISNTRKAKIKALLKGE